MSEKPAFWILDPPERMEPDARWKEWLASLRELPQDYPEVAREVADAERWIARRSELEREREQRAA
ncbi:MAG: hypothetical protein LBJ59_10855 [Zoogloeaceae bacterium]|jgi:predicted transcriptional regulator|nr:hypothetical protein [Zoogloeaceae bacterium]